MSLWGALWVSDSPLDGHCERLLWNNGLPLLFRTRREAREYIRERYGYIAKCKDLQSPPHCWKVPRGQGHAPDCHCQHAGGRVGVFLTRDAYCPG